MHTGMSDDTNARMHANTHARNVHNYTQAHTCNIRAKHGKVRSIPQTLILLEIMKHQHDGTVYWRCTYALKFTMDAMRPLPRSHSIDVMNMLEFSPK